MREHWLSLFANAVRDGINDVPLERHAQTSGIRLRHAGSFYDVTTSGFGPTMVAVDDDGLEDALFPLWGAGVSRILGSGLRSVRRSAL